MWVTHLLMQDFTILGAGRPSVPAHHASLEADGLHAAAPSHTQKADVGGGSKSQGNNAGLAQHSWISTHMCMAIHTHSSDDCLPLEERLSIAAVLTYQQEEVATAHPCEIHNES